MASTCILICLAVACTFLIGISSGKSTTLFGDANYWMRVGRLEVEAAKKKMEYNGRAKNVIIFVGDGMDITTQTLASYLITNGERHRKQRKLNFQKFPNVGLSRTYTVDGYTPDSAATATALFTGVKCRNYVVGYDATVKLGNCGSTRGKRKLKSIFREAKEAGMYIGVVSTDSLMGATPAATYANSANRNWGSTKYGGGVKCTGIADQLFENAKDFNVLFGGGKSGLTRISNKWKAYQRKKQRSYQFVSSKSELSRINPATTDYAFGLFAGGVMAHSLKRQKSRSLRSQEPSLTEMVNKAVGILSRNKKGFFLMVENAGIDKAHHGNQAKYAVHNVLELDNAVRRVKEITKPEETLIIVTADHGHTTSFGNYMPRGQNIFDFVRNSNNQYAKLGGGYYTAIGYGAGNNNKKAYRTKVINADNYVYQSIVPKSGGSHGAAPVAIYAYGVLGHWFSTLHEQTFVYHVMKNAACLGEYSKRKGC